MGKATSVTSKRQKGAEPQKKTRANDADPRHKTKAEGKPLQPESDGHSVEPSRAATEPNDTKAPVDGRSAPSETADGPVEAAQSEPEDAALRDTGEWLKGLVEALLFAANR
jgi:hypothetical protein